MLDNQEFQLSELSLASYTALKARGDCPFVAVPVALSKIFRHSCIYVRKGAGIAKPEDLRGKRVGTSQYSSTGLCFMRGMLRARLRHQVGGHALVHGRAEHLRRAAADPAQPAEGDQARFPVRHSRRWRRCSTPASSTRCCRSTSRKSFLDGAPQIARLWPNFKEVETGLLPAHKNLSDHAHGRGARGRASRASLGGEEHLQGVLPKPRRSRSTASTTPMRCIWRCRS